MKKTRYFSERKYRQWCKKVDAPIGRWIKGLHGKTTEEIIAKKPHYGLVTEWTTKTKPKPL